MAQYIKYLDCTDEQMALCSVSSEQNVKLCLMCESRVLMEDNGIGRDILTLTICKCLLQDLLRKPRKSSVRLAEIWAEICRKDLPQM
jgi:hypothetical protein